MPRIYNYNELSGEWEKSDGTLVGVLSGEGGVVESVNGKTGKVELTAEDVGALPNRPPTEATLGGVLAKVETPTVPALPVVADALGNLLAKGGDEIIAQGTSGIWTYKKYKSGIMICYYVHISESNKEIQWGSGFETRPDIGQVQYPAPFISTPSVFTTFLSQMNSKQYLTVNASDYGVRLTNAPGVLGWRPTTAGPDLKCAISILAIGRWK